MRPLFLFQGTFDTDRMRKNFALDDGTMYSGTVLMALGKHIEGQNAHELLVQLRVQAGHIGALLKGLCYSDQTIGRYLSKNELDGIMSPENILPHAVEKILRLYRLRNGFDKGSSKDQSH